MRQKEYFGQFDIITEIPFPRPSDRSYEAPNATHRDSISQPENDLVRKILPRSQLQSTRSFLYTPRERFDTMSTNIQQLFRVYGLSGSHPVQFV